jgi:hypothetical protein
VTCTRSNKEKGRKLMTKVDSKKIMCQIMFRLFILVTVLLTASAASAGLVIYRPVPSGVNCNAFDPLWVNDETCDRGGSATCNGQVSYCYGQFVVCTESTQEGTTARENCGTRVVECLKAASQNGSSCCPDGSLSAGCFPTL